MGTRKKSYVNNALLRHRATLVGILESNLPTNSSDSIEYKQISDCYFARNPMAKSWEKFHDFKFYRFVPEEIHYVGGFGGSHYIGWIDIHKYQNAPATDMCKDWGPACRAVDSTGTTACCPSDNDNAMHSC